MNLRSYYWDMGTGDKRISLLSFDFHETVVADIKYTCTRKWWSLLNISKNGTIDALSETNVDNAGWLWWQCWQLLKIADNFDGNFDNNIDILLTECWHTGCPRDASASKNVFTFEFVELNIWMHTRRSQRQAGFYINIIIMITKARWFHIKMIIMITKASRVPHQRRYWSRWLIVQQRMVA